MENQMLVSIIVPVFNIERYIEKCILSIINQTYENIEIILVDDGSTDNSGSICDSYLRRDARVKVVHKCNEGLVSARKAGLDIASGEYVLCIDGDDWIDKNRVEIACKEIVCFSEKIDMLYLQGVYFEYENNSCYHEGVNLNQYPQLFEGIELIQHIMNKNNTNDIRLNQWNWMVRRTLLLSIQTQIDNRISMAEDIVCIVGCLCNAKQVHLSDNGTYHYVQNREEAMTNNPIDYYEIEKILIKEIYSFCTNQVLRNAINKLLVIQILLNDYKIMNHGYPYLFPYPETEIGGKVAVYGAGKYGRKLMESLLLYPQYEVVAWVDKNVYGSTLFEIYVETPDVLLCKDYDYLIIAVYENTVEQSIRKELSALGVPDSKIVYRNKNVMENVSFDFILN